MSSALQSTWTTVKRGFPSITYDQRFLVGLLFLALVALTFQVMGNTAIIAAIGLVLCVTGCLQGTVRVDMLILVPLLVFDVFGMAASWAAYATLSAGFTPMPNLLAVIYLLMAHLDRQGRRFLCILCVLWVSIVAAHGLIISAFHAAAGAAGRMGGMLNNPNALGILLVTGWFALQYAKGRVLPGVLHRLEPIILAALGATLSMGSFLAMSMGLLVSCAIAARTHGWRKAGADFARTLARIAVPGWFGLLLYLSARMQLMLCTWVVVACVLVVLPLRWTWLSAFLNAQPLAVWSLVAAGVAGAVTAIGLRHNAAATFLERLQMMESALSYILRSPWTGVGPGHWQRLDYNDGGIYFNTIFVHNAFLHVGVELGLPAMTALIVAAVRFLLKRGSCKSGAVAVLTHGLIDLGFFYESVPALAIMTMARPQAGGARLGAWVNRSVFVGLGAVCAYDLLQNLL